MYDMVLKNGNIVFPGKTIEVGTIGIKDGLVAALASSDLQGKEIIDATGKYILPGVIEAHSHLGMAAGEKDLVTETSSAAVGGVTTVLFFLRHPDPYDDLFNHVREQGIKTSFIDFSFHIVLCNDDHLRSIQKYVKEYGVTSFKLYQTYRGKDARMANFGGKPVSFEGVDDGFLLDCFKEIARFPEAMAIVHAENIEIINREKYKFQRNGRDDMTAWADSRPVFAEVDGIRKTLSLASEANCRVVILHLTSAAGLEDIRKYREKFDKITVEVVHPYLMINENIAVTSKKYKFRPPFRSQNDIEALWNGLEEGLINHIASDHVPRKLSDKMGDMWNLAAGGTGTPYLLPIALNEGYHKRGLPLEKIAALLSLNPAKLYGMYPEKGDISIGGSADLVIVDLNREYELKIDDIDQYGDFLIYEGLKVKGYPEKTILRGKIIAADGKPVSSAYGWGKYIPRYQK
jgi:dihydropyrimidinase